MLKDDQIHCTGVANCILCTTSAAHVSQTVTLFLCLLCLSRNGDSFFVAQVSQTMCLLCLSRLLCLLCLLCLLRLLRLRVSCLLRLDVSPVLIFVPVVPGRCAWFDSCACISAWRMVCPLCHFCVWLLVVPVVPVASVAHVCRSFMSCWRAALGEIVAGANGAWGRGQAQINRLWIHAPMKKALPVQQSVVLAWQCWHDNQSTNQPINQSIHPPINPSFNQSFNQSISQ